MQDLSKNEFCVIGSLRLLPEVRNVVKLDK